MITDEERIYLKNTLALMNCIINSGERHSKKSNEMLTYSFKILKPEVHTDLCNCEDVLIPLKLICSKCGKVWSADAESARTTQK